MIHHTNPFIRGYQGLSIRRVLFITYEDDCPPSYLPLHESQAHLPDDEVQLFPCIFCDHFALVTEGQEIADALEDQCQNTGIVRAILFEVTADDFGTPVHVGDTYSAEAARDLVKRLTFQTGHYSRCWEISSAHVTEAAMRYLEDLADTRTPIGLMFEAFWLPECHGIGCKLICTPWTAQNLQRFEGLDAENLRLGQQRAGVPESLIDLLHLAAQADTRILILDPDAPILQGLPLQDHR